jgi:hypothetical protein
MDDRRETDEKDDRNIVRALLFALAALGAGLGIGLVIVRYFSGGLDVLLSKEALIAVLAFCLVDGIYMIAKAIRERSK